MARTVKAVYYRGGSSKAVFFHEDDIPKPGPSRDRFIKRLMGTPDPIQIDGMGGSRVITSKVAIVRKSHRDDADIDYTFAQVGITDDTIGYKGNCGNISAAVGPFALSENLVEESRPGVSLVKGVPSRVVRIFNTGTQKMLVSHVPVDPKTGKVLEEGDFSIAAVPGTGAPILLDYSQTIGASCDRGLLPTFNIIDTIEIDGKQVGITICDVANLIVYTAAKDVGLSGGESTAEMNSPTTISKLKEVRGKAAKILGRCTDWTKVDEESPFMPMVVVVAPDPSGKGHLQARLILDNKCHDSMAGTGAVCTAACSRIGGSIVNQQLSDEQKDQDTLEIHHPLGIMPAAVMVKKPVQDPKFVQFETLSFVRTARRIMTGELHLPSELEVPQTDDKPVNGVSVPRNTEQETKSDTDELSSFVATTSFDSLSSDLITKLKDLVLDHIGVAASAAVTAESSDPFLTAIQGLDNGGGTSTVYGKGRKLSPRNAALLNGAFSHSFDFDDTLAVGASHPGASVIPAALAQAEASNASGRDLLVALAVGYEIVSRLSRALGDGAYPRGFHNTSTAGIFGAVAAIAKIKDLSETQVSNSFGLAGSKAAGTMQFLDNGSWNKRLHPGFAAHDAFMCVALAEAGVTGASNIFEGKWGFLHAYSDSPRLEGLTDGLGNQWLFTATALKPYPACRMTHSAIEIAARVSADNSPARMPKRIAVRLSPACYNIVGVPSPNKRHPKTTVDAQFSIYYQVAVAWIYGADLGWAAYEAAKMNDKDVADLCDMIEVVSDKDVLNLETRMVFDLEGQDTIEERLIYPLGEQENPFDGDKVRRKFRSLAEPVYGVDATKSIMELISGLDNVSTQDIMKLL